jgi:hypothetical protein
VKERVLRTFETMFLILCGLLLSSNSAFALGDASKVTIAQIELVQGGVSRPSAWSRMLYEVQATTSVETASRVVTIGLDDPALFEYPFAVLVGDGAFEPFSVEAIEQLRAYLTYGGFLFIDDTTGLSSSPFDASVRRLVNRLFPSRGLSPLASDHSLYRAFFLLDAPVGRVASNPWLEGVTIGETTRIIYCRNDLSGALVRDPSGRNQFQPVPNGERQRREAVKLGINLVLYALTSNYKQDQAHVRQLMQEGRLE